MERPLLTTRNLDIHFAEHGRRIEVVTALSYDVFKNATLAIIGESGSGKSISCRALLGVLPTAARATGSIRYAGTELLGLTEAQLRPHRGSSMAMVFQDSERALNPTMQIGHQITEAVCAHDAIGRKAAYRRTLELLHLLRLPRPQNLFSSYPHELSGGMRQRVMIGVAIAANPTLLIADEPTSALDQATAIGIMNLLADLQRQLKMALILVSHDIRLVRHFADAVLVMQAGRTIEYANTSRLLAHPQAAYTKALLDAVPGFATPQELADGLVARDRHRDSLYGCYGEHTKHSLAREEIHAFDNTSPLLKVHNLTQELPARRTGWAKTRPVQAICGVSFNLSRGEILGIVGETGAGKSTLVRALVQAPRPTNGSVIFRGRDLTRLRGRSLVNHQSQIAMIFQDPSASLDPTWRVKDIVEEPLIGRRYGDRETRLRRVSEVLDLVDLPIATYGERRPGQLSGGQCQRVAIARALVVEPALVICDEALSSLDALIQKQMVTLFRRLRTDLRLAFILISHDLPRLREICDRVLVMFLGQVCEIGPARVLCHEPFHPYMAAMLAGIVSPRLPASRSFEVDPPSLTAAPSGCRFRMRCDRAQERCTHDAPQLQQVASDHLVACHYPIRR